MRLVQFTPAMSAKRGRWVTSDIKGVGPVCVIHAENVQSIFYNSPLGTYGATKVGDLKVWRRGRQDRLGSIVRKKFEMNRKANLHPALSKERALGAGQYGSETIFLNLVMLRRMM